MRDVSGGAAIAAVDACVFRGNVCPAGAASFVLSGTATASALLDAARIEAGQPRFGIDFTQANIPLEAGLAGRAINFDKGCYPGQEVICRINSLGAPARRHIRLCVSAERAPEPGSLLFRNGREVGYITSAVRSQRLGPVAAMGYLGKRHCEQGTTLQVGEADAETAAEVVAAV